MSDFLRDALPWLPPEHADWLGWALIALGLLLLIVLLWRLASGSRTRSRRASEARLAVVEAAEVDQRRRLVLVRRDGVEHLLMIGGPGDVVIETGIGAQAGALRRPHGEPAVELARSAPMTPAPLTPAPAANVRSPTPQSAAKRSEPTVPPRITPDKVEPPAPVKMPDRREPAFTRTAGSNIPTAADAQPHVAKAREAEVIEFGETEGTRRREASDARGADDLVAEIDDILNRTSKDRS